MKRRQLIVVQKNDHSLGYFDPETGAELGRVEIDRYPHEFALSNDRRYAYCCHFGVALAEDGGRGGSTVSIVDLAARKRIGTLDCGAFRRPHDIALDRSGWVYVLSEGANRLLVAREPSSGRFDQDQPTGGEGSHILTVTGDGQRAFSSNMKSGSVTILFPQAPERPPVEIPVGLRPEGSLLDAEEKFLYVANRESADISVIDVEKQAAATTIETRPGPVRVCWDQRGRLLVPLYHDQSLAVIDPHRPKHQDVLPLPGKPVSISFDTGTETAFISTLGDEVCLVDTAALRLVRRISTRSGPDPTAIIG